MEQVEWNDVNEWQPTQGLYYRFNNHVHSRNPSCKTLLAFGGWNFNFKDEYKDIFTTMAESAENRAKCISSIISWVRQHNFDGIDIDWEYPANEPLGGRPQDFENYVYFIRELRAAIDAEAASSGKTRLLLVLAVAAGYDKIEAGYDVPNLVNEVDFVDVMTYDLHGQWELKTGAASGLYPPSNYEPGTLEEYYTGDYAIQTWIAKGMPRNKIVMGLAAYGRGWTLASSAPGQGIGAEAIRGCEPMKDTQQEGVLNYIEALTVIAAGGQVTYDEATTTMYVQKGDQWYSYEDPNSIVKKVDYIKQQGLLGAMIWAVDNDEFYNGNPIINAIYNNLYTASARAKDDNGENASKPSVFGIVMMVIAVVAVVAVVAMAYFIYRSRHAELPVEKKLKVLKRTTSI